MKKSVGKVKVSQNMDKIYQQKQLSFDSPHMTIELRAKPKIYCRNGASEKPGVGTPLAVGGCKKNI